MKRVLASWVVLAFLASAGTGGNASAQDPEGARPFCDENEPMVMCTDDTLEVVFPLVGANDISVWEYTEFVAGTTVDASVVLEALQPDVEGWSYAVKHDPAFLELDETTVTTGGTALDPFDTRVDITEAVDGGFFSAIILSRQDVAFLPVGRQVVAKATYRLTADAGAGGTRIQLVSEEIGPKPPSPPTPIVITIGGRAFEPRTVVDGIVRRLDVPEENCSNGVDDDGDGLVDLDDPDCRDCPCPEPGECTDFGFYFGTDVAAEVVDASGAPSFTIASRNVRPLLAFQLGVSIAQDGDSFLYRFSDELGTDAERIVEVLMTDNQGISVRPARANRLISDTDSIATVERGAALAGFVGGDFLEFDVQPGVGGPGFFLGYVSDLDDNVDQIPATGPETAQGCPTNELLTIGLGPTECPGYALYHGSDAVPGQVDARGETSFAITSRNASPLLGLQFGVRTMAQGGGVLYEFVDDIGTDADRLVEVLMTDAMGNSIFPATPNTLLASDLPVTSIERGAAIAAFDPGDYLNFELNPLMGGPGFFVGYVSDLDGNINQIPANEPGDDCPLNELFIVNLEGEVPVCPDFGLLFGSEAVGGTVDARGAGSFAISSRNADPLLAFQLGVSIVSDGGAFRYAFSNDLGTDASRVVELLMTTNDGNSVAPRAVNDLLADVDMVASVERGSAIAALDPGDFLDFDAAPGVGGPGFFVGYVSDLDDNVNQIPATAPENGECPLNELLVVRLGEGPVCPEFGYLFGSEPLGGTIDLGDELSFAISSRNADPLLAFQLGVSIRPEGEAFRYAFSNDIGTDASRVVELIMTNDAGNSIIPRASNELLAASDVVIDVARGSAIAALDPGDFLDFDTAPGVGGPGFFVGYVSDLDDNVNQIPATAPQDGECPLNELVVVTLSGPGNQPFIRGDADGSGRLSVSDAVIIIQSVIMTLSPRFQCDDLRDVNDDEAMLVDDALPVLAYLFQMGPEISPPFFACEVDPTDNGPLGCQESNCAPAP